MNHCITTMIFIIQRKSKDFYFLPYHLPRFISDDYLFFCHLFIGEPLLDDHEECTDDPVDSESSRELIGEYGCHDREDIEHHFLHILHVGHARIFFYFHLFAFCFLLFIFRLSEPHLDELENSCQDSEDDTDDTSVLLEF